MAINTLYVAHGILLPSTGFISQLSDWSPNNNLEEVIEYAAGHPEPLFTALKDVKPDATFRSKQLATILGETGVFGADQSAGNVDLYMKKVEELGSRVAAATLEHLRLRASQAYLAWTQISAEHKGDAEISCRLAFGYDGVNDPLVAAGTLALAGTSTAAESFGLGPVNLNGTNIPGLKRVTLDLGLELFEEGDSGEAFTTFVAVKSVRPILTVETLDATNWTAIGIDGLALTECDVFFRKRAADGYNVADATASHIQLTADNGMALLDRAQASNNELVTPSLRFLLRAPNSTTPFLTISTGAAIP